MSHKPLQNVDELRRELADFLKIVGLSGGAVVAGLGIPEAELTAWQRGTKSDLTTEAVRSWLEAAKACYRGAEGAEGAGEAPSTPTPTPTETQLRQQLRDNFRYTRDRAEAIGVSYPTMKRWMEGQKSDKTFRQAAKWFQIRHQVQALSVTPRAPTSASPTQDPTPPHGLLAPDMDVRPPPLHSPLLATPGSSQPSGVPPEIPGPVSPTPSSLASALGAVELVGEKTPVIPPVLGPIPRPEALPDPDLPATASPIPQPEPVGARTVPPRPRAVAEVSEPSGRAQPPKRAKAAVGSAKTQPRVGRPAEPAPTQPLAAPQLVPLPPDPFLPTTFAFDPNRPSVVIGSWNLQNFSLKKLRDLSHAAQRALVGIILQFDVLVCLELRDFVGLERLVHDLLPAASTPTTPAAPPQGLRAPPASRPDWRVLITPPTRGERHYERYGFVYRRDRVRPLDTAVLLDDPEHLFVRQPGVAAFRAGMFDFVLIAIHLMFGSQSKTHLAKRNQEARLIRAVLEQGRKQLWGERDLIVLGDFNLDREARGIRQVTSGKVSDTIPRYIPLISGPTMVYSKKSYDNILLSEPDTYRSEYAGARGVLNCTAVRDHNLSDHYPVWARFYTDMDDDRHKPLILGRMKILTPGRAD